MEPVRCAVVGIGMIGREHARILATLPEARLLACCDVDPAAAASTPPGTRFSTDLDDTLAADGLEAVFVCVPQHAHRAIVERALARGLAVFCEKPIAHTLEDADAMIQAAAAAGSTLAIGHTLRFDPDVLAARDAVAGGEIGDVVHMAGRWCAPDFEGRIISGRTTVPQEMMIHDIDLMRWIAGPIDRVYAEACPLEVVGPGPDAMVATLRFRSGAVAVLDHSWIVASATGLRSDHRLSVFGTQGSVFVDSTESPVAIYGNRGSSKPNTRYYSYPRDVPFGAFATENRYFLRSLRDGSPWPISLADARAALACAVAIERAAETGLPMEVDE